MEAVVEVAAMWGQHRLLPGGVEVPLPTLSAACKTAVLPPRRREQLLLLALPSGFSGVRPCSAFCPRASDDSGAFVPVELAVFGPWCLAGLAERRVSRPVPVASVRLPFLSWPHNIPLFGWIPFCLLFLPPPSYL